MKKTKRYFFQAAVWLALFLLFTLLVKTIDVRPAGPRGSTVGFAAMNTAVFTALGGYHPFWYTLTNRLGLLPVAIVICFALQGLVQLLRRRSLKKVDADLLLRGVLYALIFAAYVFFELCIVNYSPAEPDGELKASYPSSHTMLAVCVMSTTDLQLRDRVKRTALRQLAVGACTVLLAAIVVGRLISGVHWFTDIIGALLLSAALISAYRGGIAAIKHREIGQRSKP